MNPQEAWNGIGLRPWRLAILLLGFAILLAVSPLVARGYSAALGCSAEERGAFVEFPQYGGREIEPGPSTVSGGCAVFYDTPASQERVANYYTQRLEAHGWDVEQREYETTVSGPKKRTFDEVEITARRGDFFYGVLFESHAYYIPPRPGVHVAVHVRRRSKKPPPPCGSEEKAALSEFPHYGGAEVGKELEAFPLPGKPSGACVTGYPAKGGSQEEVASYYEKELNAHGWKVKQHSSSTEASRNGLRYVARYWANPGSMEVEAQVYKDE
jgi:hypothetical protein